MITRNIVEKAESVKVPARYSISYSQFEELSDHYLGRREFGFMLFRIGYMQGIKAAYAEMKEATSCRK